MLPDPLHPAVVHFPMALAVLVPVGALLAALAIRRGAAIRPAWLPVILLGAALVASSWLALETGEHEEEVVEDVVAEEWIEAHEEAAEVFMTMAAIFLLAAVAGLLSAPWGERARLASVVLGVALLASGVRVGHLGGELVYAHGAANAYGAPVLEVAGSGEREHAGEHEREHAEDRD